MISLGKFIEYIEKHGGTCKNSKWNDNKHFSLSIYDLNEDINFFEFLSELTKEKYLELNIHNCYFKSFPQEILELENLCHLTLDGIYGDNYKPLSFPHNFAVPNLFILILKNLGLNSFNMTWIQCPKLEKLKLIHIFNTDYDKYNYFNFDFSHLYKLRELELSYNNIKTLNDIKFLELDEYFIKYIKIKNNEFVLQNDNNKISCQFDNYINFLPNLSRVIRKLVDKRGYFNCDIVCEANFKTKFTQFIQNLYE